MTRETRCKVRGIEKGRTEKIGMKSVHDLENSPVVCKMLDGRKQKTKITRNILEKNMKEKKRKELKKRIEK